MKITIVCGFFLPVPAVAGGAVEKMWWRLAKIFTRRGHEVTLISRRWSDWPHEEERDGVCIIRVPGMNHRNRLWQNLLLDAVWGSRVLRVLPTADILVTNTVALPIFVRRLRPQAGLLVVNLNRFPKGQVRWYRRAVRIQAASSPIAAAAKQQAPALTDRIRVMPNPVNCQQLNNSEAPPSQGGIVRIGFIGRIHPEKGLRTLIKAADLLSQQSDLPPWQLVLRGPVDVPRGGGGDAFVTELRSLAPSLWDTDCIRLEAPLFDVEELAKAYHNLAIFCYPTEAATGEAHPVAVLEAMAAGLPVVASNLPVFADQLRHEHNALLVPAGNEASLAAALACLMRDVDLRQRLGSQARDTIWTLDDEAIATQHLQDFESLLHASRA